MKGTKLFLAGLVVLNVFVLGLILSSGSSRFSNEAEAQVAGQSGRYLAVSSGLNTLWVIEESSQKMLFYKYDPRNNRLIRAEATNLRVDFLRIPDLRPRVSETPPR